MFIQVKAPSTKFDADKFVGDVWADTIVSPQVADQRLMVVTVRFAPGARTAWHSHERGQALHVTDGVALMQSRGGDIICVLPGQTVYTPAGEVHWHGATPNDFMTHYAIYENGDDPQTTTTWLEHVQPESGTP